MCVSFGPANFSGTKILLHQMELSDVGNVRVLLYQNTVQSFNGMPNAMLLHIPTDDEMSEANFIDMSQASKVLDDMVDTFTPVYRGLALGGDEYTRSVGSVQVFESGEYTVVLADDARDIRAALKQVPEEKRPYINPNLLEFYQTSFPKGFKFVLACFNNKELLEPAPIALYYKPSQIEGEYNQAQYFTLPGLDCHTGNVPAINSMVDVDHWIFVSDAKMEFGVPVNYRGNIPDAIAKFLPARVVGRQYTGVLPNGDFTFQISDVLSGQLPHARRIPPSRYY